MNRLRKPLALSIFLNSLLAIKGSAQELSLPPLPQSMASMGDSITAGMLANFRRQDLIYPWVQLYLLGEVVSSVGGKRLNVIERRHLSWAAGLDPQHRLESHARKLSLLRGRYEEPLQIFNAAVSGADSEGLESQYQKLSAWSQLHLNQGAPDYVTLMLGPNDICAKNVDEMTETEIYKERIQSVLHDMLSKNSNTHVLISTVPDIERLRKVAVRARLFGVGPLGRCENLWKLVKTCPTLTVLSRAEDRARVAQRVKDYNQALEEIAESETKIFGDRIRLAKDTYKIDFSANDLSIDCFHPNPKGQKKIAEATWKSSWWAPLREH